LIEKDFNGSRPDYPVCKASLHSIDSKEAMLDASLSVRLNLIRDRTLPKYPPRRVSDLPQNPCANLVTTGNEAEELGKACHNLARSRGG
jgi:hypothetical protein